MEKIEHYGIHLPLVEEYICYKRNLGFKMGVEENILLSLSDYACEHGCSSIEFTKSFVDEWVSSRATESQKSRNNRICCFRGFSYFLVMKGYKTYIPKIPKFHSNFTPYIFSESEMNLIFRECDSIRLKKVSSSTITHIIPCIIRLLYATGVRIGEAIALNHKDVRLNEKHLFLKGTKNGQDRIVPLSESICDICRDYITFKKRCAISCNDESPFFTNRRGERCKPSGVRSIFERILIKAGVPYQGDGKGPRVHDLRHTFCVRAMAKLSKEGFDMYYSMPILMTYVGHQSLASINKYIRMTNEHYPNLLNKLSTTYKGLFPSVGIDSEDYEEL